MSSGPEGPFSCPSSPSIDGEHRQEWVRAPALVALLGHEEVEGHRGHVVGEGLRAGELLSVEELQIGAASPAGLRLDTPQVPLDAKVGKGGARAAGSALNPDEVPLGRAEGADEIA